MSGPGLAVPDLISTLQAVAPDKHEELDELRDGYNGREISKEQIKIELTKLVGRPAMRQALLILMPDLDRQAQIRKIEMQLFRSSMDGDAAEVQRLVRESSVASASALRRACIKDFGGDLSYSIALDSERITRMLLQNGADASLPVSLFFGASIASTHARSAQASARQLVNDGAAPPGSAPAIVVLESEGWTTANRHLMPAAACERAVALARVGVKSFLPNDAWNTIIIPRALHNEFGYCVRFRFPYRP